MLLDSLAASFNGLWAIEVEPPEMDLHILRRRFGQDLRLIGRIDLDCLLAGPQAINREVRASSSQIAPKAGISFDNVPLAGYCHFRRLLEELTGGRCIPS